MYKMKGYRKLGRTSKQRRALLRGMTTDLFANEELVTTEAKAKELRKTAEKMITLGKKGDLAARRKAEGYIFKAEVTKKLFDDIAPRYADRNGGYTRIIKLDNRRGDNAELVKIELV